MTHHTSALSLVLSLALTLATASALAVADAPSVYGKQLLGAEGPTSRIVVRSATLPAHGLFEGDQLSAATRARLDATIANASDLDVEVVLLMPAGPWKIDGKTVDEHSLTPARLTALRQYLTQHSLSTKRIYVESRIDHSTTEPRLIIELVGTPAPQ